MLQFSPGLLLFALLLAAHATTIAASPTSLFSGWLINTTYTSNTCSGPISSIMLRSFDSCFAADATHTLTQREYCTSDASTGNWAAFTQLYADAQCTLSPTIPLPPQELASGPKCDARGNQVVCSKTLPTTLSTSYPRAFIESIYAQPDCAQPSIYQRIIAPPGGCVLITVERTDTTVSPSSGGTLTSTTSSAISTAMAYFKVESCEVLSSGMVAFGSLYGDNKCADGEGIKTSHMLPKGCLPAGGFAFTFSCG